MDDGAERGRAGFRHDHTRNGFAGPRTGMTKPHYGASYTRIEGSYAPRLLDPLRLDSAAPSGRRALPVPLLTGEGVAVSLDARGEAMRFAQRNVCADELHYVIGGSARMETEVGVLDLVAGDFVLLPRAMAYRLVGPGGGFRALVVAAASRLVLDPAPPGGVLDVAADVDAPRAYEDPVGPSGEHEVVVRHAGGETSYFYDFDPLRCTEVRGEAQVRRFNIDRARGLGVTAGGLPPGRLIDADDGRTLVYYLGARRSDRPPIHLNADFDEVIVYAAGPGRYGGMANPGMIAWTPKGIPHHGPEEDVAEPYRAWLVETRATLALTPEGTAIADMMETGEYGVHPNAK